MSFGAGARAGAVVGVLVTRELHRRPDGWGARLGRTRFRLANLPVGGALALALAAVLPGLRPALLGASAGMTAAAVGWRFVDPLPVSPRA